MTDLSKEQIQELKDEIDAMSREDMCRSWRFAKAGHPFFDKTLPLYDYFMVKFNRLGGFSPSISKKIGFDNA